MMSDSLPEAAIFIDGDWLHYTARRIKRDVDYASLLEALREVCGNDVPVYFFGSYDPQDKAQVKFLDSLGSLGYIVEVAKLKKIKDRLTSKGLDVSLAVHAALLPAEVKTVLLISGDGDFVPLLEQLRSHGRNTIVITLPAASRKLVNASGNHFMNLERLLDNIKNGRRLPNLNADSPGVIPPKSLYVERGEYFAPYLAVRQLFKSAKKEIILIDPYVNDQVLQMVHLLPASVKVSIITNRISPSDFCVQVGKLRSEGYAVSVRRTADFHDRFLCVDGEWWHSGHSFKDLGGKDSLINRVEDEMALRKLKDRVRFQIESLGEHCV